MKEYIVPLSEDEALYGYKDVAKELLRCKDCKWCRSYYHGPGRGFSYECSKLYLTSDINVNDFCSRAERRR